MDEQTKLKLYISRDIHVDSMRRIFGKSHLEHVFPNYHRSSEMEEGTEITTFEFCILCDTISHESPQKQLPQLIIPPTPPIGRKDSFRTYSPDALQRRSYMERSNDYLHQPSPRYLADRNVFTSRRIQENMIYRQGSDEESCFHVGSMSTPTIYETPDIYSVGSNESIPPDLCNRLSHDTSNENASLVLHEGGSSALRNATATTPKHSSPGDLSGQLNTTPESIPSVPTNGSGLRISLSSASMSSITFPTHSLGSAGSAGSASSGSSNGSNRTPMLAKRNPNIDRMIQDMLHKTPGPGRGAGAGGGGGGLSLRQPSTGYLSPNPSASSSNTPSPAAPTAASGANAQGVRVTSPTHFRLLRHANSAPSPSTTSAAVLAPGAGATPAILRTVSSPTAGAARAAAAATATPSHTPSSTTATMYATIHPSQHHLRRPQPPPPAAAMRAVLAPAPPPPPQRLGSSESTHWPASWSSTSASLSASTSMYHPQGQSLSSPSPGLGPPGELGVATSAGVEHCSTSSSPAKEGEVEGEAEVAVKVTVTVQGMVRVTNEALLQQQDRLAWKMRQRMLSVLAGHTPAPAPSSTPS